MAIEITPSQAPELLKEVFKANLCPMIFGSPGISKSAVIQQIADSVGLKLIDVRLSQLDPVDMSGMPTFNEDRSRSHFAPTSLFPLKGDPIPDGYNGWLLLLDEINTAPQLMQAASYKLILDRQVGTEDLHPSVFIAAAGNLSTDRAITNKMSTAMQSRMINFVMGVNLNDWLDWANEENIDHRIVSFIKFKPELLHNFNPNHNDLTFPSP